MSDSSLEAAVGLTGIVLAGGRSKRFGSDKLSARIDGRTLLELAVAAVTTVATEILIVLTEGDDRALPAAEVPLRRIVDPERFGGPLIGLRAGLEAAREPLVLVVGGDMPALRPEVLAALIRTLLAADDSIGATVLASRGSLVPLPAALRTGMASDHVGRLVEDGERRLLSLFDRLPTRVIEEGDWRPLDPDGDTVRDVDRPSDL